MTHQKSHPHHKSEMEHHKIRASHKRHNMHEKSSEYSSHPHMADNRMVKDSHQEGIKRVMQRKGDMDVGQHGSMSDGWKHGGHKKSSHFSRSGSSMPPARG